METFKTFKEAVKVASKMIGYTTRIIKHGEVYVIQCNGYRYLMSDGFVN